LLPQFAPVPDLIAYVPDVPVVVARTKSVMMYRSPAIAGAAWHSVSVAPMPRRAQFHVRGCACAWAELGKNRERRRRNKNGRRVMIPVSSALIGIAATAFASRSSCA